MSVSNDSILAFGFSLEEELPECLNNAEGSSYENFEDMLIAKSLVEPDSAHEYKSQAVTPAWIEYYKKVDEVKAACPVELVWFCSYEYTMYFMSLKGTKKSASRGYTEEVNTYAVSEEDIAKFKSFCEDYDIEWQEPKWYIFGMNG